MKSDRVVMGWTGQTVHYTRWYAEVAACGLKLLGKPVYASVRREDVTCTACLSGTLPPSGCLNCVTEPTP